MAEGFMAKGLHQALVVDAPLAPSRLFFGTDLQPVFQQDHARIDDGFLDQRRHF